MSGLDLVVAGNLLVDDIVFHDGRTVMGEPGGGALYVSLAASLWGVRVGLVSLLGTDYPAPAIDALRAHAVDLDGLRPLDGAALRSWLLYEPGGRQIVHQIGTPGHATVSPGFRDFPPLALEARTVHVCPMPFAYQRDLVAELARAGVAVTLDPHETVREDNLAAWHSVLEPVGTFFVSHEELRLDGAERDPRSTLRRVAGATGGPSILLKSGAAGGWFYDSHDASLTPWTSRATQVVDTTGAGDAFAGGFLASRLRSESPARALQCGVVSASFAIESWGPRALMAATPAAAERRLLDWFGPARAGLGAKAMAGEGGA